MPDDLDTAAARRLARRHAREETLDPEAIYGSMLGHVIMTMLPRFGADSTIRFLTAALQAALVDWRASRPEVGRVLPPPPLQPRTLFDQTYGSLSTDAPTTFALCRVAFVALSGLCSVYPKPIEELPDLVEGQLRQLATLLGVSVPAAAPATPAPSDEPNAAS